MKLLSTFVVGGRISMIRLSVLTLNLWNINKPLESRLINISRFLLEKKPDIVALQEVSRYNGQLQCHQIGRIAGYHYIHYSKSGCWFGREEGLAILTRQESIQKKSVQLPMILNDMPRILQQVKLVRHCNNPEIWIANTHYAYHINANKGRAYQAESTMNTLINHHLKSNYRLILCGDLNDTPNSPAVNIIFNDKRLRFRDAWLEAGHTNLGHTFSKDNPWADSKLSPGRRIDYVGVSEGIDVESCNIVFKGCDGFPPVSDHYGLLTFLRLKE